jgi:hypothetical protein
LLLRRNESAGATQKLRHTVSVPQCLGVYITPKNLRFFEDPETRGTAVSRAGGEHEIPLVRIMP